MANQRFIAIKHCNNTYRIDMKLCSVQRFDSTVNSNILDNKFINIANDKIRVSVNGLKNVAELSFSDLNHVFEIEVSQIKPITTIMVTNSLTCESRLLLEKTEFIVGNGLSWNDLININGNLNTFNFYDITYEMISCLERIPLEMIITANIWFIKNNKSPELIIPALSEIITNMFENSKAISESLENNDWKDTMIKYLEEKYHN